MVKRVAAFICCTCMFLAAGGAFAEVIQVEPIYYNISNDVPAWKINPNNPSEEAIQEIRGGTFSANLLPIDDDTLLWYGAFEYHFIKREEWHTIEYDVDLPREDAYAVAVDRQGNRKWSLGLSDPHAQNAFTSARLLPDGRILLLHYDPFGEWGSQYYIITANGEVQEMLPSYKVEENGVRETLRPMHGGFFGGGVHVEDGGQGVMYEKAIFAFYDAELNLIWGNQSEAYAPASFLNFCEVSDGILIAGTYYSGYDHNLSGLNQAMRPTPMVSKIGLDGETEWIYRGHDLSATGAGYVVATSDGGALFSTGFDPTAATPFDAEEVGTLVKLDGDGALEWVRQYNDEHPFWHFAEIIPYEQGFLIAGMLAGDSIAWAVLYISEDGTPIDRIDMDLDGAEQCYVSLVAAPDGTVYAHGSVTTSQAVLAGMDQMTDCRLFYLDLGGLIPR